MIKKPLWETVWQFLIKLDLPLPHDTALMLLHIYPVKLKTSLHIKNMNIYIYTGLFITT